ncbi:MAG: SGNH/GDSL hydrolase family protein, partial [Clostridia bacterium]|nr:SGNH/GDSL hydrolase family protein [Clostridia bacterium]
ISFGSGCSGNIADNSYAGIIKNAVSAANGGKMNYGFMPAYTTNWSPKSEEVCAWPTMTGGPGVTGNSDGWSETDSGDRLMSFGLTAYKLYASLTYKLRSGYNFQYICVYYQTGPSYGSFVVADNLESGGYDKAEVGQSSPKVYDCENTVNETKRTGFFRLSDFTSGGVSINIVSNDNQPVTITGLGFYNDISGNYLTFNKYTRGGAMLTSLSDTVLEQAATSGTLILGLGYNDFFWGNSYNYTKEAFSGRINKLIEECNKNGTNVIVNDYLWSNYKTLAAYKGFSASVQADIDAKYAFFHSELQRLARETGGIYVNQEAVHGQAIIDAANANDGVHPTNTGHNLMAGAILEAMGLR